MDYQSIKTDAGDLIKWFEVSEGKSLHEAEIDEKWIVEYGMIA